MAGIQNESPQCRTVAHSFTETRSRFLDGPRRREAAGLHRSLHSV
jgi:hypothetical protein